MRPPRVAKILVAVEGLVAEGFPSLYIKNFCDCTKNFVAKIICEQSFLRPVVFNTRILFPCIGLSFFDRVTGEKLMIGKRR